jgi:hypothetical protein
LDGWLLARAFDGIGEVEPRTQIRKFREAVSALFGARSAADALTDLIGRRGLKGASGALMRRAG